MQNKRRRERIFTFKRKLLAALSYSLIIKVLEAVLTQSPAKATDKLDQRSQE